MREDQLRLYLVADPDHTTGNLVDIVTASVAAGATMVQLRAKRLLDRQLFELAVSLRRFCHVVSVPLIINDRLDIALAAGADGVHLGVDDLPVPAARAVAGPEFIIGFSPETDAQIEQAAAASDGASYLGIGPVFGTATKSDAGDALGLATFADRVKRAGELPVVGIGGINASNAADVVARGASGVAVVSAILNSSNSAAATRALRNAVER